MSVCQSIVLTSSHSLENAMREFSSNQQQDTSKICEMARKMMESTDNSFADEFDRCSHEPLHIL